MARPLRSRSASGFVGREHEIGAFTRIRAVRFRKTFLYIANLLGRRRRYLSRRRRAQHGTGEKKRYRGGGCRQASRKVHVRSLGRKIAELMLRFGGSARRDEAAAPDQSRLRLEASPSARCKAPRGGLWAGRPLVSLASCRDGRIRCTCWLMLESGEGPRQFRRPMAPHLRLIRVTTRVLRGIATSATNRAPIRRAARFSRRSKRDMATYYVHCIVKKPSHDDPYTRIQEYGVSANVMDTYGAERWSEDKMIDVLERKLHLVRSFGKNPRTGATEYANLEVHTRLGRKYVKSANDGDAPDNLLNLRECGTDDKR